MLIVFAIMLIALINSTRVLAQPNEPHIANAMWIEPSSVDLRGYPIGYMFNVTLWVNVTGYAGEIGGWQFKLIYNKAYLNATRCAYTKGTKSEFFENITTVPVDPLFSSYNATHDYVLHGESWMSGPARGPGYGSLSWVEFNITVTPLEVITFTLDISTAQQVTPPDTYVLDWETMEDLPLTAYNTMVIIPEFTIVVYFLATFMTSTTLSLLIKKSLRKQKQS